MVSLARSLAILAMVRSVKALTIVIWQWPGQLSALAVGVAGVILRGVKYLPG